MTTSRIVRGTKGRVFLYICAILFVTGLIACYNNVRVQLDETHKSFDLCRKEQENLSTQLQVIYDYKQRLEKSLKTEKGDHQRTKNDLESRINEEKMKNEKNVNDAKLKFSTLQQHYNLLQTQHDDFKEECSKIQRSQLDEINNLQAKLKEVQEQLKTVRNDNENSVKHLKTQNDLLREEKIKLEKAMHGIKPTLEPAKRMETPSTRFAKQVKDGDGHYALVGPDKNDNNYIERPKSAAPESKPEDETKNVIAAPSALGAMRSSSTAKTFNRNLGNALPLVQPSPTPETHKKVSSTSKEGLLNQEILPAPPHINKQVPEGVVPLNKKSVVIEESNDQMNNRDVFDTELTGNELEKLRLKNSFHDGGDDNAKEELDMPVMQINNNNNNLQQNHIDVLAAAKDDPEYDHHIPEEDDDPVDGENIDREQQEIPVRQ